MKDLKIKPARKTDIPLILTLIKELAEIEKFPFEITVSETELEQSLFGDNPAAEVVLAFLGHEAVGFAVYYQTFATTTGRPGLHLDDLYVRPRFQGNGIGQKLLGYLASLAMERGCARLEWWALEWNKEAIGFYESIGARNMQELRIFRLQDKDIRVVSEDLNK